MDEQELEETKKRRGEAEEVIAYASNAEFFVTLLLLHLVLL